MHRALSVSVCVIVAVSRRKSPLISPEHRSTDYISFIIQRIVDVTHMCSLIQKKKKKKRDTYMLFRLSRFNEPNHIDADKLSEFCRRKSRSPCTCLFFLFLFFNVTQRKISRLSPIYSDLQRCEGLSADVSLFVPITVPTKLLPPVILFSLPPFLLFSPRFLFIFPRESSNHRKLDATEPRRPRQEVRLLFLETIT